MHPKTLTLLVFLVVLFLGSCTSIKPYQRAYLNDSQMEMGSFPDEAFETSVFSYREGGLPMGSESGRGGCGCN